MRVLTWSVLIYFCVINSSLACALHIKHPFESFVKASKIVFIGTAQKCDPEDKYVTFVADKVYKGTNRKSYLTTSLCKSSYYGNYTYIVFASPKKDAKDQISLNNSWCSGHTGKLGHSYQEIRESLPSHVNLFTRFFRPIETLRLIEAYYSY